MSLRHPVPGYCLRIWLIGSPKLQIIFHKRATKYRSLLRKMTYKDMGSYESSPPCTWVSPTNCMREHIYKWYVYSSHTHIYIRTCLCIYICTYYDVYIHNTHIFTYVHVYVYVYVYTMIYISITHTYLHTYMYMYIYMYILWYIYS